MSDGTIVSGSLYFYAPNKGAAISFTLLFGASGLLHLWQCYHKKCFKLMGLHLLCCLMFTIGFAMRAYGTFNYLYSQTNLDIYIASTCFIYMAPPLLELANYHVLGRVLYYVPYLSPLHPGRVLTTFGALSGVVEVLNALGIVYTTNPSTEEKFHKLGDGLIKASLVSQIVVIALFCLLAGHFHWRCSRARVNTRSVTAPLITLYISTVMILVRCVYRSVEHFDSDSMRFGPDFDVADLPPIMRHEWFFYVFEASFMISNTIMWNWQHPRRYLPQSSKTYLAQDGCTELQGPGWKDDRPFLVTLMDPFDWLTPKKEKGPPFWETNGYAPVNSSV